MLTHACKKELVDKFCHLGMSICYGHVLRISAQMGNSVCELYHREHVVYPPKLHCNVFTSSAVDNIDLNPIISEGPAASNKWITCHTSTLMFLLLLVASRGHLFPATSVTSLNRDNFKEQTEKEYHWLDHTKRVL